MDEVLNLVIYFDIRIKENGSFNTREIQYNSLTGITSEIFCLLRGLRGFFFGRKSRQLVVEAERQSGKADEGSNIVRNKTCIMEN